MNRIVLVGRLENTPEIRFTSSGIPVSNFSLSVRRSHPNSEGVWERDVFRIVTWRKLAETCCKYLEKGRWIAVDGKLQNRYLNTPGNERRVMVEVHADDIRFLDFRPQQQRDVASDRSAVSQPREQQREERVEIEATSQARTDGKNGGEFSEEYDAGIEDKSEVYRPYLEDEEGTPLDLSDY